MMLEGSIQGVSGRLRWPGYFRANGGQGNNGIWVTAPAQHEADFEVYHRAGPAIHSHPERPAPRSNPLHGALFETWSACPAERLSAAALRRALKGMPQGVLRLKGLLRTDEHGWSEWQYAGRHGSLRRARWLSHHKARPWSRSACAASCPAKPCSG